MPAARSVAAVLSKLPAGQEERSAIPLSSAGAGAIASTSTPTASSARVTAPNRT